MFFNRYLPLDQYVQKHFEVLKKFNLKQYCSIDEGFVYFLDDFYEKINHIFIIDEKMYEIEKDTWCEQLSQLVKYKTKIDCKINLVFDDHDDNYLNLNFNGYSINYFDKKIENIAHFDSYADELGNLILKMDNEYFGTGHRFLTELGIKTLRRKILSKFFEVRSSN